MKMRFVRAISLPVLSLAVISCAGGAAVKKGPYHVWPAATSFTYEFTEEQTVRMAAGTATVGRITALATITAAGTPREYGVHFDHITRVKEASNGGDDELEPVTVSNIDFTVQLDERGRIAAMPGVEGNEDLEEFGGADWARRLLQPVFFPMPEGGATATGTRWDGDPSDFRFERDEMVTSVNVAEHYQISEETFFNKRPAYRVSTTTNVSVEVSGEQMGTSFTMVAHGTTRGPAYVDMETGRLLKAESQGSIDGKMKTMGMDMPMELILSSRTEAKP